MKRARIATAALALLATLTIDRAAAAQAPSARRAPVKYETKIRYDFDDDIVEGDLTPTRETWVEGRHVAKHRSLVRLRTDFLPELLHSADRL
jgi:hypothetical protein